METQKILSYLGANDISYDKDFARAQNEGCIAEYADIFNGAYQQLEKYVKFGLNNGFSSDTKDCITRTTKIITDICQEKNTKGLNKITLRLSEIDREMTGALKKDNAKTDANVANKVLEYVENYSSAITAMLDKPQTVRKEVLISAKDKLSTIQTIVNGAGVVCTVEALELGKNIVFCLKQWAKDTAVNMHTELTNAKLDEAIASAEKWSKLTVGLIVKMGIFSKKSNLATDLTEVTFVPDDFSKISTSVVSLNKIVMFKDNLATFKKSLAENRFNTEEDEQLLEKQKERKKKLLEEQKENDADFDNGIIDDETYVHNDEHIVAQLKDCNDEMAILRKSIISAEKNSKAYTKIIRKLELLNKVIISFQDDPRTLDYIVGTIDFTKIMNVLRGYGSSEEIQHILNINFKTASIEQFAQEKLKSLLGEYEEQEKEFNQEENEIVDQEAIAKKQEEMRKKAEEIRRARRGGVAVEQKPVEQKPVAVERETEQKPVDPISVANDILDD